ncbi:MAG: hypothetical protein HUJ57_06640 [Erysipelotrichaceae bacterium]|nr:hypothetical protein [Erysipelotrichaceae bacterium]
MKRFTLKQRLRYWFDNQMAKGTASMVRLLAYVTIIFTVLLAIVMILTHAQEEGGFFSALWDSTAYTINAWMPSYGDGSPIYVALLSIAGIVGLLITSVLISILTTSMEERITSMRQGNSLVLETGHTVILGFNPGNYELIRELCMAAGKDKQVIVVAGEEERQEMEDLIADNVEHDKNVKIICRSIDIYDPVELECCNIPDAKNVVINLENDHDLIKCLMALNIVLKDAEQAPQIIAFTNKARNVRPARTAIDKEVLLVPMESIIARMTAHTCTQVGIARTFYEIFSFTDSEFYIEKYPGLVGCTFEEVMMRADNITPVGLRINGTVMISPPSDTVIEENDELLVLAQEKNDAFFREDIHPAVPLISTPSSKADKMNVYIFGHDESIVEVIEELKSNSRISTINVVCQEDEEPLSDLEGYSFINISYKIRKDLEKICHKADHIIILSRKELDPEESDMNTLILILRLREIRKRLGLRFNITAEIKLEKNKALIQGEYDDFIIASDVSSMIMAQIAVTPALFPVFSELLSQHGNELYLIPANISSDQQLTHYDIRQHLLERKAIYLGYTRNHEDHLEVKLNPPASESITFQSGDGLIIISASEKD